MGGLKGVCDVVWKYCFMNIIILWMYIDFRCFFLVRNSDCSFEVKKIGKWYFGVNVWLRRIFGGFENDGNFVMFSDIWLDIVFW